MWQQCSPAALRRIMRHLHENTSCVPFLALTTRRRCYTDRLTRITTAAATRAAHTSSSASPPSSATPAQSPSDTLSSFPAWHNAREVTSHVGELGTMSPRAIALRKEDELRASSGVKEEESEDERAAAAASRRRREKLLQMRERNNPLTLLTHSHNSDSATIEALDEDTHSSSHGHTRAHVQQTTQTRRYSGVQLEILGLYHQLLREVARMEDSSTRHNLRRYIRAEFDKHAALSRRDIAHIEWQVNYAKRKLEELREMSPTTRFTVKM